MRQANLPNKGFWLDYIPASITGSVAVEYAAAGPLARPEIPLKSSHQILPLVPHIPARLAICVGFRIVEALGNCCFNVRTRF
jgi:hypothetical protein